MGSVPPPFAFPSTSQLRLIGRYLLCDLIASGGMATVHLGRLVGAEGFSRTVAIKQLYQHFARSQEFVTMFLDEARILSRIRHPHVVAPLDVIVLDGELFIVMEYVHGVSLAELLDASAAPIPPRIVSAIIGQTLLGLHAAHEATSENGEPLSIVHRDVSPQNILVGEDGIARVVDFGIAKAQSRARTTGDGSLKGKLGYMAPEQLRNQRVDRRTDLFTTGIVLWEALTGGRLYAADNVPALFDRLENTTAQAPSELVPDLPPELDQVFARAITLDPAKRVATAREMALELQRAIAPASTLEVSEWVESLSGPALLARAQRISELEAVDITQLTRDLPRIKPQQVVVPDRELDDVTADVTVISPMATERVASEASLPPVGVGLSAAPLSRDLGVAPELEGARRRRSLLPAGLILVALGVAAVVIWAQLRETASDPSATIEKPKPTGAGTQSAASAIAATTPVLPPPRALSADSAPPTVATAQVAAPPASAATAATELAKPAPRKRKEQRPVVPTSERSEARPTPASGVAPRPNCAVPYTIDQNGVKRFKTECF